eukprot:CAMPEP_0113588578 /NCGR_PEP_ID=MMETSP0015_2-20120614/35595_1 /TAXON_ID=2838 /ORGANISM="Odontella" /LENGTH=273 /DNA_ID=CAMNT_0000494471 /DNA_START=66 /DNA_END=888 /DNA_ORIENTATION=- /assembly_acc=CAM_ASM_000160
MAAALPVTKLAGLLVKTLAKPLAKRIKHDFSRFPVTQTLLIRVGQTTHALTSRLTIWSAGYKVRSITPLEQEKACGSDDSCPHVKIDDLDAGYKVRSITPLEQEKAMSKGADFLGESIVFLVGGGVVVWEYNLSKEKEKKKEEKRLRQMDEDRDRLQAKLNALDKRLAALERVMKANARPLVLFGGERYVEPDHVVPIDDTKITSREDHILVENMPSERERETIDIRGLVGDMEKGISDPGKTWSVNAGKKQEKGEGEGKISTPSRRWNWWPF